MINKCIKYPACIGWALLLLVCVCGLSGCQQEDDIQEIFASGQVWHWSSSYRTTNWKNDNEASDVLSQEQKGKIADARDAYNLIFKKDGTLEGKGDKIVLSGTWSANGKDQSFSVQLKESGQYGEFDRQFVMEIKTAKFYRGDSKHIKLFNADKNYFIQFYPTGFNQ